MDKITAINTFDRYNLSGRYVFGLSDLKNMFPEESERSIKASIRRLIDAGILIRAAQSVYVNNRSAKDSYILEHISRFIRRGEYNYISLELALSQYGIISQIPVDRLTVITTGRKGEFRTPWGVIEMTHTDRNVSDILRGTTQTAGPLRMALPETALRDIRRVGRNLHLVDNKEMENGR
ncbi:type IV toxin-antitoxin system AbiEi family antitoxin [Klebsiella variicola]|uniref:type IV toxin-antitoxin system AbiEi family antitoxin n=1 Tax=Klebsiella variicola TaxID=244366 RepID=UPI003D9662B6